MTTVNRAFAFRPELTVAGSGNYTVPAGKYAYLTASCGAGAASSHRTSAGTSVGEGSAGGSGSGNGMWLAEGDAVSVSNSGASSSSTSTNSAIAANSIASVRVNASNMCIAVCHARMGSSSSAGATMEISGLAQSCYGISVYDKKSQHIPE